MTTKKFLREHPLVVRNFVKSYIEAVHRLKSDRALGLKIAAKYLRLELLQRTYESSIDQKKLPTKQYPSAEGIKTILDELALKDPKAKAAKPSDLSMRASSKNSPRVAISTVCTGKRDKLENGYQQTMAFNTAAKPFNP